MSVFDLLISEPFPVDASPVEPVAEPDSPAIAQLPAGGGEQLYGNKNDQGKREDIRPVSENQTRPSERERENPSVEAPGALVKDETKPETQGASCAGRGSKIGEDHQAVNLQPMQSADRQEASPRPPRRSQQEAGSDLAVSDLPQEFARDLVLAEAAKLRRLVRAANRGRAQRIKTKPGAAWTLAAGKIL